MTINTKINKKKILDFVSHFAEIAKAENWISHYDAESDSFAIRTPRLSDDARKEYVNNEFAFYVNPKSDVEGVFIEYFVSNFVAHHKDFEEVAKELRREQKEEEGTVIALKKDEVRKIVPELQDAIINSFMPNNV